MNDTHVVQSRSKVLFPTDSPSLSSRGTQRSNISLTKVEPWTDKDSLELISNPGSGKRSRKITPTPPPLEKEIQAYKPTVENGLLSFVNDRFTGVENVNALDMEGFSALHRAVLVDDVATVVFLLDNDADINIVGKARFTPLHSAVKYVHGIKFTTVLIKTARINGRTLFEYKSSFCFIQGHEN